MNEKGKGKKACKAFERKLISIVKVDTRRYDKAQVRMTESGRDRVKGGR